MIVYVDVVISFNFIVNFLILCCVKWISGATQRRLGIFLSSLFGGVYSVFMFDERFKLLYGMPGKLIFSAIMVLICFKKKNYIKLIFYFYIVAFAFSGAAVFINNITGVLTVRNGLFNYENSFWVVIAAAVAGCLIIGYVLRHMRMSKKRYGEKTDITLSVEGKEISVTGMMDTGNSLLDPITLYPVIVVEYDRISDCVPKEMSEFLKEGSDLNCNMNRRYLGKIRLIPYNSVGSCDILKGFRPDYVKIGNSDEKIKEVIIAVTYGKLSKNDEFDAILNPMM